MTTPEQLTVNGEPIKYQLCPNAAMVPALVAYFERGRLEGPGFLYSLLTNDLRGTFENADDFNRVCVYEWVKWLYNYAPGGSWGSHENVVKWIEGRRQA